MAGKVIKPQVIKGENDVVDLWLERFHFLEDWHNPQKRLQAPNSVIYYNDATVVYDRNGMPLVKKEIGEKITKADCNGSSVEWFNGIKKYEGMVEHEDEEYFYVCCTAKYNRDLSISVVGCSLSPDGEAKAIEASYVPGLQKSFYDVTATKFDWLEKVAQGVDNVIDFRSHQTAATLKDFGGQDTN